MIAALGMTWLVRLVYSALTLYMVLIILRWLGGWLELEVEFGRLRWISRVTEPLIDRLRKILPSMGPLDFGPIAALLLVWVVRVILVGH
jgi:YggT family protein